MLQSACADLDRSMRRASLPISSIPQHVGWLPEPPSAPQLPSPASVSARHRKRVDEFVVSSPHCLPLVGQLCAVAKDVLGAAGEFGDKADDVLVAARRVEEHALVRIAHVRAAELLLVVHVHDRGLAHL